jgi:hypothetical protein
MENKAYSEKLKDPRWQRKRLEILERDKWCCQRCFDSTSTLHVHHLRYIPGCEPWSYPQELYLTLCEECHSYEFEMMPSSIDSLIEQIKHQGFLADDIRVLASAFNGLNILHSTDVTAAIIEYVFRNNELFNYLKDLYFKKNIRRNNEAK